MNWLALDIGTTSTKAAVLNAQAEVIRSAYWSYPTHTEASGAVEQDAAAWWQAVVEAVQELDAFDEIDSIALTGQMQDLILVDAHGDPVRPVILYSDTRARSEAEEVNRVLDAETLRTLTGNSQDAGGLLAKLLWLHHHEPDALANSAHLLLGAADVAALKMTDSVMTDSTTASSTGLLNLSRRKFHDADVFAGLGLNVVPPLLPAVNPGGAQAGTLSAAAAELLNLRAGIPVFHGPGDAGAATLGAGSGEIGSAYLYLGTSGWVAFTAQEPAAPGTGVITIAHPNPQQYIQVAPLLTAGGNLEWMRDLFGATSYDALIDAAMQASPTQLLYLPYLNGERSPFTDPAARGAFIGLNPTTSQGDMFRAVLEGVAFAFRHAVEALMPTKPDVLTITGGGARSSAWSQLLADVIGTAVHIAGAAEHVGVRGAILAAQVQQGSIPDYRPANFLQVDARLIPSGAHEGLLQAKYRLFRACYPALRAIFAQAAELDPASS